MLSSPSSIGDLINDSHMLCSDGLSYYVVAMARRSSSDLSLLEMHERSSCHPGMRTTVGWTVPVGYLVNTSQIRVGEQCNFPRGETKRAADVSKPLEEFSGKKEETVK